MKVIIYKDKLLYVSNVVFIIEVLTNLYIIYITWCLINVILNKNIILTGDEYCKSKGVPELWLRGCKDKYCALTRHKYDSQIHVAKRSYSLVNDASTTVYTCVDKSLYEEQKENDRKTESNKNYGNYWKTLKC